MTAAAPRVSVVTPFYNTAKYLEICIESVLGQTFTDFEYILADNCSNDGSAEIARKYAARDPRIRYVRFEELIPQVPNYNRALGLISPNSRYTKMVQADDYILPGCLKEMVAIADAYPNVGLVSSYEMLGNTVYQTGLEHSERVLDGREVCRRTLKDGLWVFGSPNTVMYRSSCVRERKPFFSTSSPTEDVDAGLEILLKSDFAFVHQVLTYTRRENVSTWTGINAFEPVPLHRLIMLMRYGRQVLSPEEFEAARKRALSRHGRTLARGALTLRRERFWNFHRSGLESVGLKLSPLAVSWHVLLLAGKLVLNPLETFRTIVARVHGRPYAD
jgi:glycosyltransferase involved in cell wall biosynthesis